MAIGLVAGVAIMRREKRERLLMYLAAFLVMWVALVLSNSRGGLLAMVAQVVCAPAIFLDSPARVADAAKSWTRSVAGRVARVRPLLIVVPPRVLRLHRPSFLATA